MKRKGNLEIVSVLRSEKLPENRKTMQHEWVVQWAGVCGGSVKVSSPEWCYFYPSRGCYKFLAEVSQTRRQGNVSPARKSLCFPKSPSLLLVVL